MFSIETSEDIKLLKELTNISGNDKIIELESEVRRLSEENLRLIEVSVQQKKLINEMSNNLITADQCRDIVFDLLANKSKPKNLSKKGKVEVVKSDRDEFNIIPTMKKKFNKIIVEGNTLIHHTVKNQKMKLPITTIEMLAMMEVYQKRQRQILNKDAENFCKLYDISKIQMGKLYYNIKEGVFFSALEEIDNQIKRSNFKISKNFIYIMEGGTSINTQISIKTFNYLLNVYVNSEQPYAAIYKLSKEFSNINPIHLLVVLRRNVTVSEIIKNTG